MHRYALLLIVLAPLARAEDNPAQRQAFFGDLHVHTAWSFDGFAAEQTRLTPEAAYEYALGNAITVENGETVQREQPLDFLAVTDHAEYLGVIAAMADPQSPLREHPKAEDLTSGDPKRGTAALFQIAMESAIRGGGKMDPDPILYHEPTMRATWRKTVDIADAYYRPGTLTTFAGFEWSSTPSANVNLHRNVIFRDTGVLPERPFSMLDSNRPEDLWAWMQRQRDAGATLLAIPHNANMSAGHMYPLADSDGEPLSEAYIKTRLRNEPLSEIVQVKGQSMIHPVFSPDEAAADFEIFNFTHWQWGANEIQPGSYVRPSLLNGLGLVERTGLNPYQFGFIGSSDSHTAYSQTTERSMLAVNSEDHPLGSEKATRRGSGGLAGVWAEENSRERIYAALERKEAFATSGPKIAVRFFMHWTQDAVLDLGIEDDVARAYEIGVPMGQVLPPPPEEIAAPAFPIVVAAAQVEEDSPGIDRLELVKGWIDREGEQHSAVIRLREPEGRPSAESATVGVGVLNHFEHTFDPDLPAFYYVRVLQRPTPRWTTLEARARGLELPAGLPETIRERAWSSPIWYYPPNKK